MNGYPYGNYANNVPNFNQNNSAYNSYQNLQNVQPQQNFQQIIKVNGIEGAKAFQLGANSSVMLLDAQEPIVWLKTSDGAGFSTITPYEISKVEKTENKDINLELNSRIEKLEKKVEELTNAKSDVKPIKSNTTK